MCMCTYPTLSQAQHWLTTDDLRWQFCLMWCNIGPTKRSLVYRWFQSFFKSIMTKWLSVPFETISVFLCLNCFANSFSVFNYNRWSGSILILLGFEKSHCCDRYNVVIGSLCKHGNKVADICLINSWLFDNINPLQGPLKDSWVLVVTTLQCSIGEGCNPVTIRPVMCEMSASKNESTISATLLKLFNLLFLDMRWNQQLWASVYVLWHN